MIISRMSRLASPVRIAALLVAGAGFAEPVLPPAAETARADYRDALAAIEEEDGVARERLVTGYGKALFQLEEMFTTRGVLEGVVAVQREQDRLLAEKGAPAEVLASAPKELQVMQRHFMSAMHNQDRMRDHKVNGVSSRYLRRLEMAKVRLTRERSIEQALAVDREITRLKATAGKPPAERLAVASGGGGVWEGFETEAALKKWEVRTGPRPGRVTAPPPPEGAHWLRAMPGNLLATEAMPRDWSGASVLSVAFFNRGRRDVQLELLIGDDAWLGAQTYWNRHNGYHVIKPGASELRIPLANLFRGEAGARNREIARNIDLDKIRFMSLKLNGGEPGKAVLIDALRLTD